MNIFGVGGPELIAILIIMLVFAGPKRMIHWSYIMGQYIAKFRVIWSQTVDLVQKEFDEAGVDIKIPKEPPTRQNFNKTIADAIKPMTQPIQDSLNEVKKDIDGVKEMDNEIKEVLKPTPKAPKPSPVTAPTTPPEKPNMGTWESASATANDSATNDTATNMGTWSSTDK